MNFDRRYCQNRVQKRKKKLKILSPEIKMTSAAEEERQFKLKRFVQDVHKFVEEKENRYDQKNVPKEIGRLLNKIPMKTKPSNLVPRRGLFQNGVQTKFYSRGAFGKEITARLDEDLKQIISLANEENNQNSFKYSQQAHEPRITEVSNSTGLPSPQLLHSRSFNHSPSHHATLPSTLYARTEPDEVLPDNRTLFLQKLDSQLYPEFTRIVTLSSIESKSMQFRDKSYVTDLKKKLLEIHQRGKKEIENNEELSCPSDVQKSSVATSPFRSPSQLTEALPGSQLTSDKDQGFTSITLIREPRKSTSQFLEETIGLGGISTTAQISPEPQPCCERNIPSTSWQLTPCQDKPDYYKPPLRHASIPPPYNLMMPFDGGGDRPLTNLFNSFLPPYDEDSPEFQYFPRRMF